MINTTILFLSSTPEDTQPIQVNKEYREIESALSRARNRQEFFIVPKTAVRPSDLRLALLENRPHIIHFAGHGSGCDGIALEDDSGQSSLVSEETLSELFKMFPQIECVVLCACYSEVQAQAIAEYVDCVIGIVGAIDDATAIEFVRAFYDSIGAGESYEFAFRMGRLAILDRISEQLMPILITKPESVERFNARKKWYSDYERFQAQVALATERHSYAQRVVMKLLDNLAHAQRMLPDFAYPNLSGMWRGMADGRDQIVTIKQYGPVVYLNGSAVIDSTSTTHIFNGEGRVVFGMLVFHWWAGNDRGINILNISKSGDTLDGMYFSSNGATGFEVYQLVESTNEVGDMTSLPLT